MKKSEVRKIIARKSSEGYITHSMSLDLYSEDDDIPEDMLWLFYSKIEKPRPITFYCGVALAEKLEKALAI